MLMIFTEEEKPIKLYNVPLISKSINIKSNYMKIKLWMKQDES